MIERKEEYEYQPDYAIPPGETLRETLEALGMTQKQLARRTGISEKTISEIINAKAPITPRTALHLEKVVNVPAGFWNKLESNYRERLAEIEERNYLRSRVEWLKEFPVTELKKRGCLPDTPDKSRLLECLLRFLGIGTPETWEQYWSERSAAFRKSPKFETSPGALAVWLRMGEIEARKIQCEPYDRDEFRRALTKARNLTVLEIGEASEKLRQICARAGVAVVYIPRLPKLPLSGATRWITPGKAVIQLNLRHKKNDHFWFTFFHEAGHILYHSKKSIFLDNDDDYDDSEGEANRFASDWLIPKVQYARFLRENPQRPITKRAVRRFSRELGIAPGIVVGRLQHDGHVLHRQLNDLKVTLDWAD